MPENDDQGTFSAKLYEDDREALDAERVRLVNERFQQTGRLVHLSLAEAVSDVLEKLHELRRWREECSCGAACETPEEGDSEA